MKIYNVVFGDFKADKIKDFCVNNFLAISSSIKSLITQINTNSSDISKLQIKAINQSDRPISSKEKVIIIINKTTNKLNFTYDSGKSWYNSDGTSA